jgi:hypothetical protein
MNQDESGQVDRAAIAALMKLPDVVGVGRGCRERAGRVTDELALRVYVAAKKSVAELRPQDVIPPDVILRVP